MFLTLVGDCAGLAELLNSLKLSFLAAKAKRDTSGIYNSNLSHLLPRSADSVVRVLNSGSVCVSY